MDMNVHSPTHIYYHTAALNAIEWGGGAEDPVQFAGQATPYTENMVPVIDFINFAIDNTASGARTSVLLTVSDNGTGAPNFTAGLSIEAGDVDTLYIPFHNGLPLRNGSGTSNRGTWPAYSCTITGGAAGTGYLSIGYHYELPSTRR